MSTPSFPSLPAATANCIETTLLAIGANPIQNAMQQLRSLEGKMRLNFGTTSLITNPLNGVRILLDHVAMEARILASVAGMGLNKPIPVMAMGLAGMALPAEAALLKIVQLGIAIIEGHEAEGMRYLFPPGGMLTSWETWTSTKLHLPVLTRTIGIFGVRTCVCQCTPVPPHPSMFEIPPGYTVINVPPPAIR